MTLRNLNTTLRDSLLTEEPFAYAHLVKFEKPLKTDTGKSARRAKDYIYLTDGSHDIVFNDGSSDVSGNANGDQTYIANKLSKVGTVSESTQAKASSMTINVSSAALKTTLITSLTTTSSSLTATDDFVEAGFREGDQITIYNGTNAGKRVRINTFSNNNLTANITAIDTISSESSSTRTLNLTNPEIEGVISNRSSNTYARYINRDVFVYKAHINTATGAIIGAPYLLFKGIIAQGKLAEDPSRSSIVSWTLTSHWADFSRVQGRLTSDTHHRALDGSGKPDREATIRPEYASDLGFLHSEQSINLMATYQAKETRYKEKRRGGLAGLMGGKKLVEYEVEVDREVDLRFNLDAKYLPVVYGVNKIDSIPFFVDSLASDASTVFCAYALCEGEIGGIYDVYLDDTSSICIDKNDKDTRSTQTDGNTVDVVCVGRMDQGDTLTAQTIASSTSATASGHSDAVGSASWEAAIAAASNAEAQATNNAYTYADTSQYEVPNTSISFGASTNGAGITHEKGTGLSPNVQADLQFHSGKEDQRADSYLLANAGSFKVGTDYYEGSPNYWSANHRVLDTAYAVVRYEIGEGETTIPSLDFVVRGKGLKCFNYDFAYEQHPSYSSSDASASAFNLGQEVTLKKTSNNDSLGTAKIADIFNITEMSGAQRTMVRFMGAPSLGTTTSFYMTDGSNTYHMQTYDNIETSGTVQTTLSKTISSAAASSGKASLTLSTLDSTFQEAFALGTIITISSGDAGSDTPDKLNNYTFNYSGSGSTITGVGNTANGVSNLVGNYVIIKNAVRLASSASSTDDTYNNLFIEVTKTFDDGTIKSQKRRIVDYDGSSRIAKVSPPFSPDQLPVAGSSYKILTLDDDIRVSTNPAIQLLDYLTSSRYGRDLDIEEDIDLPSFLEAARQCDTGSDVTVLTTGNVAVQVGSVYNYSTSANKVLFQGEVKSITPLTIGNTAYKSIVLTNVLGKLVHRWEDWKYFWTGDLYYNEGTLYQATGNGISAAGTNSNVLTSLNLSKVSGSGASTIGVNLSAGSTFEGNPVIKTFEGDGSFSSGYSLYDSDDIKYWRYLGWESQNQRHVTRHQTNAVINTSKPLFDNINGMLGHFNGMLRYSNGKYSLGVKAAAPTPTSISIGSDSYIAEDIDEGDIIGNITVEDGGQKGTYNQVDISINDPQNRFEGRSVALFNSTYLKEDRMVPKKGSIRTPYITNYFNARTNANQYLEDSRASLKIGLTIGPRGILLLAGTIIRVTYSRFGWVNKQFRITNLAFNENCTTQVTAEEHTDTAYLIQPPIGKSVTAQVEAEVGVASAPASPTNLSATQNDRGGIELTWSNSSKFNPSSFEVEVYRGTTDSLTHSNTKLIGTSKSDIYTDTIIGEGSQTLYYWIRYNVLVPNQRVDSKSFRQVFSAYHPTTNGVVGISDGAVDATTINITNDNVSIPANQAGTPSSFANSGTTITAFIGSTQLNYNTAGTANPSFRVSNVAATGVTADSSPTVSSNSYAPGNITAMSTDTGTIVYTIKVRNSLGAENTYEKIQTFTKVKDGELGVTARAVSLSTNDQVFTYSSSGSSPSPSSTTITATKFNSSGTAYFRFIKNGTQVYNGTSNTYTYTPQSSHGDMPDVIQVELREGSDSSAVLAADQITLSGIKPGANGVNGNDAYTVILTNESHTLLKANTANGGGITYTGSGTNIIVYKGVTELNSVSGTPGTGQFKVTSDGGVNINTGTISVSGNPAQVADHNSMTSAQASVTYTINIENIATFTRKQSLTQSIEGEQGASVTGPAGKRTVQGYLYYEKSSSPNTPPAHPTTSTYTFSTGLVSGTGISTTTAADIWTNYPRAQDPTSSNVHYTVRYFGEEASANSSTISLSANSYSDVVQHTNFTGVVTFSNGTFSSGSTEINGATTATSIDGANIKTGSIDAEQLTVSSNSSTSSSMFFDGTNNRIDIKDSSGTLRVRIGNLS